MNFLKTNIHGLKVLNLKPNYDSRGLFVESYVKKKYRFINNVDFKQDNFSISKKGVIRGLHYQIKNQQDKLINVTYGKLLNFTIDIRIGSPSYLKIFSLILSSKNLNQIFVPRGCANGILSLSNNLILNYKCSDYYNPEFSMGIRWDDPSLNLNWGVKRPIISKNDQNLPFLSEIKTSHLPKFNS